VAYNTTQNRANKEHAREMLREGVNAAEIARRLGLKERTVRQWRADWGISSSGNGKARASTPTGNGGAKSGRFKTVLVVFGSLALLALVIYIVQARRRRAANFQDNMSEDAPKQSI